MKTNSQSTDPAALAVLYWNAKRAARTAILRRIRRALPPSTDAAEFIARFHR